MINYNLPIWNGVKSSPSNLDFDLNINYSTDSGIFNQKGKRIIKYENDYQHMTPLKGTEYHQKIRDNKISLALEYSENYRNILEIGGGDSYNYQLFQSDSFTIVDPAIRHEKSNIELHLISDYFENITLSKKYDLILLLSVLEHVDDPNLILKKSIDALDKDGSIFIYIPIIDSQFQNGDFNALLHEHIHYFTFNGAKNLFQRYGLIINSYHRVNDGGIFHLMMGEIIDKEFVNLNLNLVQSAFDYQLKRFIELINNDEKVLFYGATNGLNNLFHLANKSSSIDFEKYRITDSDSKKWGKYISAHPLPILPLDELSRYNTISISAPSFYGEILGSLPKNKIIISTGS